MSTIPLAGRILALAALAVALAVPAQAQDPADLPAELPADTLAGPSLVDVLEADGRFTALLSAIDAANLRMTLAEPGPYTLFAPTDSAFAALGDALVALSPEELQDVLLFHVVQGAASSADAVAAGVVPSAWSGSELAVTQDDAGAVQVNGVSVIDPDLAAGNGVVHVIDRVLLPPADDAEDMDDEMEDDGDMDDM